MSRTILNPSNIISIACVIASILPGYSIGGSSGNGGGGGGGVSSIQSSPIKHFVGFRFEFAWHTSDWSRCEQLHHPVCCGVCVQTRKVTCLHTLKNITVPKHFCANSAGISQQLGARPSEIRECESCAQDCVLSAWSEWSRCDADEGRQFRQRQLLVLPSAGGTECGPTIETRRCPRQEGCDDCAEPRFRWKVGRWSECQPVEGAVSGMGMRYRSVECSNRRGLSVKARRCLTIRGVRRSSLVTSEVCLIAQDCQVGDWSPWSPCSHQCLSDPAKPFPGVQSRQRKVVALPQNGGRGCPLLETTRPCDNTSLPRCTSYSWFTSFWSACAVDESMAVRPGVGRDVNLTSASSSPAPECGPGVQQRTVYCTLDNDKTKPAVNELKCIQDDPLSFPPPSRRPCEVPCAQHCQLGEWGAWSRCSRSCGAGGQMTRKREVLAEALFGGRPCESLTETRECEERQCSWWYSSPWSACYLQNESGACGAGLKMRVVYCQSLDDRQLEDGACASPAPNTTAPCTVPCHVCLVSQWSDWSTCSQACGATPGARRRTRSFAEALAGGATVPDDCRALDLEEWQPCGQATCKNYVWRVGLWDVCSKNFSTDLHEQTRTVICVDDQSPNELVADTLCVSALRPVGRTACNATIVRDCALTDWTSWTACSATCGADGRQARRRQIVVREINGEACPSADDEGLVFEYRACVRLVPCPEYRWSIDTSWSPCATPDGACGTGVVTRLIFCKYDNTVVDTAYCIQFDGQPPEGQRQCYVPCPGDCSLSPWSDFGPCSQTCGSRPGLMSRRRYLLAARHASTGEIVHDSLLQPPAPSIVRRPTIAGADANAGPGGESAQGAAGDDDADDLDDEGREQQLRSYALARQRDPPSPPWPPWPISRDQAGYVLDRAAEHIARSRFMYRHKRSSHDRHDGYRTMNHARRRTYSVPLRRTYRDSLARNALRATRLRNAYADARGYAYEDGQARDAYADSIRDAYLDSLHQTYFHDSPRLAPVLDPAVDAAFRCPHITEADLVETVLCGLENCPNYSWEVGEWGSCILTNESTVCGAGTQFRSIQCRREGAAYAHRNQCLHQLHARPLGHKPCNVSCPRDCQVSQWSEWTPCSQACGQGDHVRYRGILVTAKDGGLACPHLEEMEVCQIRPCTDFQWQAGQWSWCRVDFNLTCGRGVQSRQVYCPAGRALEDECVRRSHRPAQTQICELACKGNCLLSPWSEYFACDCERGIQSRQRSVIRAPTEAGYPCDELTQTRRCRCPNFELKVGNWSTCKVGLARTWSQGVQRRSVSCTQDGRFPVPLSMCARADVETYRSCQVAAARDCDVGSYGRWSQCGECGAHISKTRHRSILQSANGLGRPCPPKQLLTQNTTCDLDPCDMFNYDWYVGQWSGCKVDGEGCGSGEQHRLVQCRRNDGIVVPHERCYLKDLKDGKTPVRYENSQQCGSPCPKDCQVTEWSPLGPCYRNCSKTSGSQGYRVRTRSIVKPAGRNGAPCPDQLVDIRSCSPIDAVCPSFQWHFNLERRDVYCVSQGGLEVDGGCIESLRPMVSFACTDGATCSVYAQCNQASRQCQCLTEYEGDGRECFPLRGCSEDSHCPINGTRCDVTAGLCICEDGTEPYQGLTCDRGWIAEDPINADKNLQPDHHIWIIVGVCLAFILLLVLLGAFVFSRRRPVHGGMFSLNQMVSNNLDIPKKVSNEYVNIRGVDAVDRSRLAGTSRDTQTAFNPHYIYMNSEYTVQPRLGVSSSNFHLAVNTDDLDDEVFTDNSEDVFLDPHCVFDDDVFLDTPENNRKLRAISSFKQQRPDQQQQAKKSLGSQSSTSSVPPACYLQRKRLSSSSSGQTGGARSRLQSANSRGSGHVMERSASAGSSSIESLKFDGPPASPPDYTPPPPPPPRPRFSDSPKANEAPKSRFEYPASPKPELPPRSRRPQNIRRVVTPVSIPSTARPPAPAPRSRSSQDVRLPTSTLLYDKSSTDDDEEDGATATATVAERPRSIDRRESATSDTYLHLCEAHWPT